MTDDSPGLLDDGLRKIIAASLDDLPHHLVEAFMEAGRRDPNGLDDWGWLPVRERHGEWTPWRDGTPP